MAATYRRIPTLFVIENTGVSIYARPGDLRWVTSTGTLEMLKVDGTWDTVPGGGGAPGPAGAQGNMGPPGWDGFDGADGEMGPPGPSMPGTPGADGAAGPVGPPGLDGFDGADGLDGLPGPAGAAGAPGSAGATGSAGAPGPPGLDADEPEMPYIIPGPQGATGPAGSGGGLTTLRKTANQTINAGAGVFVDVTDLTFPVVNGTTYAFYFYVVFRSAQTTTGWKCSVNCPAGTLDFHAIGQTIANAAAGAATWLERHNVTRDDMTLLTSTVTASVDLINIIQGRYICTANGTFAVRFANELAANTDLVVQAGSWGFYF